MKNFVLITLLLVSCFAISAKALDIPTDCSDLAMLQERWETKYFYDLKFNSLKSVPKLVCNSRPYKFVKAIWVIENMKNSPKFGNIYDKLVSDVNKFQLISSQDSNPDGCGSFNSTHVEIYLFPCAFDMTIINQDEKEEIIDWDNQDFYYYALFKLVEIVAHELKHLQLKNKDYGYHVECPNGEGRSCDYSFSRDLDIATPYAFQILYLQDILKNNILNSKVKQALKYFINKNLKEKFVRQPVSK